MALTTTMVQNDTGVNLEPDRELILGVDTHKDNHVAAVLDTQGRVLNTQEFAAAGDGYDALTDWVNSLGRPLRAGVEGTSSWGAGLTRHLRASGVDVIEVSRPNRQHRRRHGKSDTADSIAAARAVISGEATAKAKTTDGPVEALRMLGIARTSANRTRTQAANQIRSVLDTAPESLRAELRDLNMANIVKRAMRFRPGTDIASPLAAAKFTLKTLARRWHDLDIERSTLDHHIAVIVTQTAPPELMEEPGVGPHVASALLITLGDNPDRVATEAPFAALCGVSPVDASTGKQQRHRLNRGGDRQANHALWRIVMVRLRWDPTTQAYMERRLAEGKTKRETIRLLMRYIARHIWKILHKNTHQQRA